MRSKWLWSFLMLLLLAAAGGQPKAAHVADVRVRLSCDASGELTQDIRSIPNLVLWNTINGEGSAPCASHATMLVFVIQGEPNASLGRQRLSVVVRRGGEVEGPGSHETARHALTHGVTNAQGYLFVPLLLNDTGCDVIRVGAMIGSSQPALQTIIPFRCGK